MGNKRYKKLTSNELTVLEASREGHSDVEAYLEGYGAARRYNESTIAAKVSAFFGSARVKYYLSTDLPNRNGLEKANKGGAPTSYRPRYIQRLIDYFNRPPEEMVQKTDENSGEISIEYVVNAMPTRAGFACELGIPSQTIKGWAHILNDDGKLRYPEFARAYTLARDFQQNILVQNTLKGHYQPSFAKFVAQNLLDWSDKRDVTVIDESKPKIQIHVDMSKEEAARIYLEEMKPRLDKK